MIILNDPAKCCGCSACYAACPNGSITMRRDSEGFLYPNIAQDSCLQCGLCEKVCPVIQADDSDKVSQKIAYAARTKDADALFHSTSGGVAYELAAYVIKEGGVVYGACYGEKMQVLHQEIENVDDLKKLQGSKYVQSQIGETYKAAKEQLETGRLVLFTGTPCQIEGLYAFLRKNPPNLITMDFICHGVPSPGLWEQYLKETGFASAKNIVFREKSKGWESKPLFLVIDKKGRIKTKQRFHGNPFSFFFSNNHSLRPICYTCPFKTGNKKSDFTVGDLWGISKLLPTPHDDKGMSLVLLNSEKSTAVFEKLQEKLEFQSISYDAAIAQNMMFLISSKKPPQREAFFREIQTNTFSKLYRKYRPKDPPILAIKKKLYPIKAFLQNLKK